MEHLAHDGIRDGAEAVCCAWLASARFRSLPTQIRRVYVHELFSCGSKGCAVPVGDELLQSEAKPASAKVGSDAVLALAELVDGPLPGQEPRAIPDPEDWVHRAFYWYRSALVDDSPHLPRLARIEFDFIAALGALNFDDQKKQLRRALEAIRSFPG